ncbi:hypothetical protein HX056_00900 [Myroides odoratimimus]|uniref:hypothetical protein n=1 Tax=Myroides odoratimimus TaxID=76832 RepID=UPI002577BFEB|nr:hypothetical protein [Myroides odoratimimus]MDM1441896.1 hypothetical protein [Myroides odoratimimus]
MEDTFLYFLIVVAIISYIFQLYRLINEVKAHRKTLEKYNLLLKEHVTLLKIIDEE